MKVLAAQTNGWVEVGGEGTADADSALERFLTTTLMAEHLVVLTGLGTSLCILDEDGDPLAPTMRDLWAAAKAAAGDDFEDVAKKASYRWKGRSGNIETLLSRCQMTIELELDDQIKQFIEDAEEAIVDSCRFVQPNVELDTHQAFLRRVARRSTNLPRAQIFTTNYDLAFETAAARSGFAVIDGFSHAHPQRFDGTYFTHDFATRDRERAAIPVNWVPNVVQLHKLHGSVDWTRDEAGDVVRDAATERPLIIYPRSTKFEVSYQQPFLELMGRFQSALRAPETGVIVVGSGLGDAHIAQPVMAAVEANVRLSLLIVAPEIDSSSNAHIQRIEKLIRGGDRRLALLDATFEDVVPAIPDFVTQTEAERHATRLADASGG